MWWIPFCMRRNAKAACRFTWQTMVFVCDMTHIYTWRHDSCAHVWLDSYIYMCVWHVYDMTPFFARLWLSFYMSNYGILMWGIPLISMCDTTHIYMSDMTQCTCVIYVRHYSILCEAPLAVLHNKLLYSHVWHASHIHVWHYSYTCVTWLMCMCDMWHMCDMTPFSTRPCVLLQITNYCCCIWETTFAYNKL